MPVHRGAQQVVNQCPGRLMQPERPECSGTLLKYGEMRLLLFTAINR
jgi:hypothetical protein